jgi:hypothetical protein
MPGWHIKLMDCDFHAGPHKIIITTTTTSAGHPTHHMRIVAVREAGHVPRVIRATLNFQ